MENILHTPKVVHVLLTALGKWNEAGGLYFYGIVFWPVAHHSKCYKNIASLYGYVMVYDSYKHHSNYPYILIITE